MRRGEVLPARANSASFTGETATASDEYGNERYKHKSLEDLSERLEQIENRKTDVITFAALSEGRDKDDYHAEYKSLDAEYRYAETLRRRAEADYAKVKEAFIEAHGDPEMQRKIRATAWLIKEFPYDYRDTLRSPYSLESIRRYAVINRAIGNKLERYQEVDEDKYEYISNPPVEDMVKNTYGFISRIDIKKMKEIKDMMTSSIESGSRELVAYLSRDIFKLKAPPDVITKAFQSHDGGITGGFYNKMHNFIAINDSVGLQDAIQVAAHETWHAHQWDVMNFSENDNKLKTLYELNEKTYISVKSGGYANYAQQLMEKEADSFALTCLGIAEKGYLLTADQMLSGLNKYYAEV